MRLLLLLAVLSVVCMARCEAQAQAKPQAQPVPKLRELTPEERGLRELTPAERAEMDRKNALEGSKLLAEIIEKSRALTLSESKYVSQHENLKGITQVSISMENLPTEFRGIIAQDDLKTAIELRCRSLGLRITDQLYRDPILYFNINAISVDGDLAYNISVELHETVLLARDMGTAVTATVWDSTCIGYAGRNVLNSAKTNVINLLDKFLNDWMKANGK